MRSRLPVIVLGGFFLATLGACGRSVQVPPRHIPIHQSWSLQPGSQVGNYRVAGGLGDVAIELGGNSLWAPFDGRIEPAKQMESCVAFTSPEVPAYLFRLCGVKRPRLGEVEAGQVIGRGDVIPFAAMRRQPDGTWALVEPAVDVLERTVQARKSGDEIFGFGKAGATGG